MPDPDQRRRTAGAQLDGVTLEEAKDKLKSTIRTMIEEGAI